jgi:anti-anti-sigma factor
MNCTISTTSIGKCIKLSGRVTFADYNEFKNLIGDMQGWGGKTVLLDLGEVEFLDSAALGMLLLIRDAAQSKRVGLVFANAKGQVKRLMSMASVPVAA